MILIQFIVSFIAVVAFSITLEIPKKYIVIDGIIGAIGWIAYLYFSNIGVSTILCYFLSALIVAVLSTVLSKITKALATIFLIPGILPTVPGIAIFQTIYALINTNMEVALQYLLQTILISVGIALATFVTESFRKFKILKKEEIN